MRIAEILIVDDDAVNRRVLRNALKSEGYQFREASSGEDALRSVQEKEPDLILLDVLMPGMDGITCCQKLHEQDQSKNLPIILVTSLADEQHIVHGFSVGAIDYITKPFRSEVVRARVSAAMRAKHTHDRVLQLASELKNKNQKLSDLTETAHRFVDDVSHEFRTPLTVITEYASIIAEGLAGDVNEDQADYLDVIINAVQDLSKMVDDLLDTSKLRAGSLRVDRRTLQVEGIIDSIRPMIMTKAKSRKIDLTVRIDPDVKTLFVDREKAGRVIVNFAINAIKFSPRDSQITLWAKNTGQGNVEVGVTDRGPGLSPEDLRVIFDRFRQVDSAHKSSTKGFGLGLNIAKQLVWINLGQVNVDSILGQGSTFSFTMPTNDPRHVLTRYFDRSNGIDGLPQEIAAMQISTTDKTGQGFEMIRRFVISSCYPHDLILPSRDKTQLVAVGLTQEPDGWIRRMQSILTRMNQQKLDEAIPHIEFRLIGRWAFPDQKDQAVSSLLPLLQQELFYA